MYPIHLKERTWEEQGIGPPTLSLTHALCHPTSACNGRAGKTAYGAWTAHAQSVCRCPLVVLSSRAMLWAAMLCCAGPGPQLLQGHAVDRHCIRHIRAGQGTARSRVSDIRLTCLCAAPGLSAAPVCAFSSTGNSGSAGSSAGFSAVMQLGAQHVVIYGSSWGTR